MNYPNPCESCDQMPDCTSYRKCSRWLKYFRTIWKQFNGYSARTYRKQKNMTSEKFIYEHPDIIRRYLEKGPCAHCRRADVCETPCGGYWNWWDARMEWLKRRWGIC